MSACGLVHEGLAVSGLAHHFRSYHGSFRWSLLRRGVLVSLGFAWVTRLRLRSWRGVLRPETVVVLLREGDGVQIGLVFQPFQRLLFEHDCGVLFRRVGMVFQSAGATGPCHGSSSS